MSEVPSEPTGSTETVEGPTPAGGVRTILLKDARGEIREAHEVGPDGNVIQRTYFPPSSLDK